MFKFGRTSARRRRGVREEMIRISDRALQITTIDFGIAQYGGLRTAKIQNKLFKDGLSELDGYERESYHQTGLALDFFAYVKGKGSWKKEHLAIIAAAFFQAYGEFDDIVADYRLEWGGLWENFDGPHVQLVPR